MGIRLPQDGAPPQHNFMDLDRIARMQRIMRAPLPNAAPAQPNVWTGAANGIRAGMDMANIRNQMARVGAPAGAGAGGAPMAEGTMGVGPAPSMPPVQVAPRPSPVAPPPVAAAPAPAAAMPQGNNIDANKMNEMVLALMGDGQMPQQIPGEVQQNVARGMGGISPEVLYRLGLFG